MDNSLLFSFQNQCGENSTSYSNPKPKIQRKSPIFLLSIGFWTARSWFEFGWFIVQIEFLSPGQIRSWSRSSPQQLCLAQSTLDSLYTVRRVDSFSTVASTAASWLPRLWPREAWRFRRLAQLSSPSCDSPSMHSYFKLIVMMFSKVSGYIKYLT